MAKKKRIKKAAQGIKKAVKKGAAKVKEKAKHILTDAKEIKFAPLLPFKKVMVTALDRKQINHTDKLSNIVPLFVMRVVKGQNNFDGDCPELDENFYLHMEDDHHNIVADVALTLVTAVINYIKNLQKAKEKGEPLTAEEEQILTMSENVAEKVTEIGGGVAEDTLAGMVKDFMFSWKGALTLVALVALLIYAFSSKS